MAIYVLFLFQLCWGPLCSDPEKSRYPVVVPLLCLGMCHDVLSNAQPGPALSSIVAYLCNVWLEQFREKLSLLTVLIKPH